MGARLGNVLYWTGCALALFWLAMSFHGISTMAKPDWSMFLIIGLVPAAIVWAIGRALRYILGAV